MPEVTENRWTRWKNGNRLHWLVWGLVFPIWAELITPFFAIGCRCLYGNARAEVYYLFIPFVWARFGIGLLLGEQWKKIWIYMALPLLMGITISFLTTLIGIEG